MTLGQRIQELRKQAGLSQEGLGEALGVSRQAVSKWESDGGIPELDTLIAMSRLFHITIGELLGVEEPKVEEKEPAAHMSEEQVEEILRRYVEESRPRETEPKYTVGSWILAGCAVVVSVILVALAVGRIGGMRNTIRDLQNQLSSVQSDLDGVRGQVNSISSDLREQVKEALEEGNNLISTCEYQLVSADLEGQTVTLRFDATLKDYAAGSKMQFLVDWVMVDGTEGQAASGFAEGPDFSAQVTLPMNYRSEVSIRVEDPEGNIREQLVDYPVYGLHPDSFRLEAYNLMMPFKITISRFGSTTITAEGRQAHVDILSDYPQLVWPEEAVITAYLNGELIFTEVMTITPSEDSSDMFCAAIEDNYYNVTLREGDSFEVAVRVTDNLGRTEEFVEGGTVNDGELRYAPIAVPAVSVD